MDFFRSGDDGVGVVLGRGGVDTWVFDACPVQVRVVIRIHLPHYKPTRSHQKLPKPKTKTKTKTPIVMTLRKSKLPTQRFESSPSSFLPPRPPNLTNPSQKVFGSAQPNRQTHIYNRSLTLNTHTRQRRAQSIVYSGEKCWRRRCCGIIPRLQRRWVSEGGVCTGGGWTARLRLRLRLRGLAR